MSQGLASLAAPPSTPPNVVACEVVRAPTDLDDTLRVVVPSFSTDRFYEVEMWSLRGTLAPDVGAQGFLAFSEDGFEALVAWMGAGVDLGSASPATRHSESVGDGSTTTFTITHGFGTKDVDVAVFANSDGAEGWASVTRPTTNTIAVAFASAPSSNQYRVVVS